MTKILTEIRPLLLMLLVSYVFAPAASPAQARKPSAAQEFAEFWAKFRTAVAKDNREAVADMTKLPFMH